MKHLLLYSLIAIFMIGCGSTERSEIRKRTPNFVALESDAPRTVSKKKSTATKKRVTKISVAKKAAAQETVAYAVTQGTMLMLDGGKQTFVPFQEGHLDPDLVRQLMEIDESHFEMFGGFEAYLNANEVTITSQDAYDQKPIYHWVTSEKTSYAVEVPEVARNRFENEKFKYLALEIVSQKDPKNKFYFHVDPRNIGRPTVIYRPDAKVLRVVMGNSEELNRTISKQLWINEPLANKPPQVILPGDTSNRSIQIMHLVRLYFSPENEEFVDEKYEEGAEVKEVVEEASPTDGLVLIGRFTAEGVVTGKFKKGTRSDVFDVNSTVQYHFKQNALTAGRGGIQDKPTRMEIEFFTLKLGQDEDQLRLALQQARYKRQQKLNVFFVDDGKRLQESPNFSFSLKRVDDAAKLAMIKTQRLVPTQGDGGFTSPQHLSTAVLELDLKGGTEVIQ